MSYIFPFILILSLTIFPQLPEQQPPLTWVNQHTINVPFEAVRCYENICLWINPLRQIHLHSGHLGLPLITTDWSEPLHTNQTWKYSFSENSSNKFITMYPWMRPAKRCGGKGTYDEGANRILFYGGSHRTKNGYGALNEAGNAIEHNAEERFIWAWNPETEQWYDMKPLPRDLMTVNDYFFRGYTFNVTYARDYGLMLFSSSLGPRIQAYSYHFNRYMLFGDSGTIPRKEYQSASYDLRHHTLVVAGNDTNTYLFPLGKNVWKKAEFPSKPTTAYTWYGGADAVSYDENTGRHLFLRGDGAATYTLDLSDTSGWQPLQSTVGAPPSAGHLGTNLHYARELNAHINFSAIGSQIWTFKLAPKDPTIPEGITGLKSVSDGCGITLTWQPPQNGQSPEIYRIYRTVWKPTYLSNRVIGLKPGVYEKVDSTTTTLCRIQETLIADETYSYYVSAVTKGKESIPSIAAYSNAEVPMGVIATVRNSRKVELKWKRHPAEDVIGFNVYRAMGDTNYREQFVRINSSLITNHRYTDSTVILSVLGDIAQYAVTAVNRLGAESGFSPLAYSVPDPIPGLWVDTLGMRLIWNKALCDTIRGYEVLMAMKAADYWDYLQAGWTTFGTITRDTSVPITNLEYAYGVRALSPIAQRGFSSDFVPCADRHSVNLGWFKGDGRFQQPVPDTFWTGLGEGEIAAEVNSSMLSSGNLVLNSFPNPFSGSVLLYLSGNIPDNSAKLTVLDLRGRTVIAQEFIKGRVSWNGVDRYGKILPAGVYVASVSNKQKTVTKVIHLIR